MNFARVWLTSLNFELFQLFYPKYVKPLAFSFVHRSGSANGSLVLIRRFFNTFFLIIIMIYYNLIGPNKYKIVHIEIIKS